MSEPTFMEITRFIREDDFTWRLPPAGRMKVPVIIYASEELLRQMDEKVCEQAAHPEASKIHLALPDRELAYATIKSSLGQRYHGAMRAGINCALANRQILMHLARRTRGHFFPGEKFPLLYDVSHNTCKVERLRLEGRPRELHVHRKDATRAFPPGHPDLPPELRAAGQPVSIGGSMGTASYILAGIKAGEDRAFSSAVHGAGRAMSRQQAMHRWMGRQLVDELAARGITVRCPSSRGVAEEAPGAYKDADAVVDAAERAGLARRVARVVPVICVKG